MVHCQMVLVWTNPTKNIEVRLFKFNWGAHIIVKNTVGIVLSANQLEASEVVETHVFGRPASHVLVSQLNTFGEVI